MSNAELNALLGTPGYQHDHLESIGIVVCVRCTGLGRMEHFGHVAAGTCFQCKGDGLFLSMSSPWRRLNGELPRVARLKLIQQALASFASIRKGDPMCDEYLYRNRKAVRTFLLRTIRENATACGPVVWDRAYAALAKVLPAGETINAEKLAANRAVAFPVAA